MGAGAWPKYSARTFCHCQFSSACSPLIAESPGKYKALEEQYPAKAQDLLKEMETDTDLFVRRLSSINSAGGIYTQISTLTFIDLDEFEMINPADAKKFVDPIPDATLIVYPQVVTCP